MLVMLLAGCGLACYYDVRSRIIPNEITYSLIAMGLLFSGLVGNLESSFYAALVMLPSLVALGYLGGMGAGDSKLLFAAALILGLPATLYLLPTLLLLGGLVAFIWLVAARISSSSDIKGKWEPGTMPFAPVISLAILAVLILPIPEWVQG